MENRKPYTVESYKAGKKAITRDGRVPTETHHFDVNQALCNFISVIDGKYYYNNNDGGSNLGSSLDLFEQEDVVVTYHNVYPHDMNMTFYSWLSLQEAINFRGNKALFVCETTHNPNLPGDAAYSVKVVHVYNK